ncbi:peptidoglycan-binding protein [Alteribacter natronophilus]|uniref:peptidoglycan-binding protein n=1 Tax=Alteribacter natronophilus TaxID=2583810 RepID=UPI00110EAC0B|nr:peptidoglycan-binding protein [Alteribacter natronophilus]TMW72322.1 hypothetical protein FGB90_08945 [Alteribacter natronophilus]
MVTKLGLKQIYAVALAVLLVFTVFAPGGHAEEDSSGELELKILHTNDIHAAIDPLGKAAAYINEEREAAERSLYLDAGDIFSGNPVVDLEYGKPLIEILNSMELDAMVIGNHEFDYGQEHFQARVEESDFPWISANTIVTDDTIAIEQPEPYMEFDLDGLSVGILGLTQSPPATAPSGLVGLEFPDPVETAREYAHKADEVDVFIGLTHVGYSVDQRLAEEVEFFDLIVGGHSHTVLEEPSVVNGTPIVQTGANSNNVGNVTITLDEDSLDVTGVDGFLQNTEELTEVYQPTQDIIDYWNDKLDELLDQEIGYSNTGLSRDPRYDRDVQLGNFWTDAMRITAGADMAFTNNGGIRASIDPGTVMMRDIYTVEPFANEITVIAMTGEAIYEEIKYSFERRNSLDLQTSGANYTIYTRGGEFYDVDIRLDGETIDMESTYTVAVADFLATGGSGYTFDGERLADYGLMTTAMIELAENYTAAEEPIDYADGEGRIEIVALPLEPPYKDGDEGEEVRELKLKLTELGFGNFPADPSERYGSVTSGVVEEFQVYYGLEVTGEADQETLGLIEYILASVFTDGGEAAEVKQLKLDLTALGFGNFPADPSERYGPVTMGVVADFQEVFGLVVNGIADPVTLAKIEDLLAPLEVPYKDGDVGPEVRELKLHLTELGFGNFPANPSETYGSVTKSVVEAFQSYYGIEVTGEADEATLGLIKSILTSVFTDGQSAPEIKDLKERLTYLGYGNFPSSPSENYGPVTMNVVSDFQKDQDLVVNGLADPVTYALILEMIPPLEVPFENGDRGIEIVSLKKDLSALGFGNFPAAPSELYGPVTSAVVTGFQDYYSLSVSGIADEETLNMVEAIFHSIYTDGNEAPEIKILKQNLTALGFGNFPENPSERYGPVTMGVVSEFQETYNLAVNGIADPVTLAKIADLLDD